MTMARGTRKLASLALVSAGLLIQASPAEADVVEIVQTPSDVANGIGYPRILVDGKGTDAYDAVVGETVEAWFTISGQTPKNGTFSSGGEIRVEGDRTPISRPGKAAVCKVSFSYVDPRSASVANVRISPVKLCNDRLAKLQGAPRAAFLKEGGNLNYPNAWSASASIEWRFFYVTSGYENRTFNAEPAPVGAIIECLALERPKVRTQTQTQGVPGSPGKRLPPPVKSATLRMEPAMIERVGADLCPTQLRLYGQVVANRPFQGSAIIFGPGFLTPITPLDFSEPGTRAVLGTYKLKWGAGASSLRGAGTPAPKSQSVSLTMNVAGSENRILEQVRETVTVTCKRAPPPRAALPDRTR